DRGPGPQARPRRVPAAPRLDPDRIHDLVERSQIVTTDERVAVRQRCDHARPLHREAAGTDPGIDPHDPVGQTREPLHLATQDYRVAAFPAVGEDHDYRPAGHAP